MMKKVGFLILLSLMLAGIPACDQEDERSSGRSGGQNGPQETKDQTPNGNDKQPPKSSGQSTALQLFAACSGLPEGEVADLSTAKRVDITSICTALNKAKVRQGINNKIAPAAIN